MLITREEVADVFRQAIASQEECSNLSHLNWWRVNEPYVSIGGWHFVLSIEADWIRAVYHAVAPDGRAQEFGHDNNPIPLLSDEEVRQLIRCLGGSLE